MRIAKVTGERIISGVGDISFVFHYALLYLLCIISHPVRVCTLAHIKNTKAKSKLTHRCACFSMESALSCSLYFTLCTYKGNNELTLRDPQCSPRQSRGKHWGQGEKTSLLPAGPVIQVFCYTSRLKGENNLKKSFAWRRRVHKFAAVSRSMNWSPAGRTFP